MIRVWKIGELAGRAGLTVRTLHHWDRVGLLRPSNRTGSGHRLYDESDVRRLYEVVALRDLGLAEWPELIAKVQAEMDADTDPADPRIRPLAARWMELLEQFDGGDPAIREANRQILVDNPEQAEQGCGPTQAMIEYVTRANRSS